MPRRKKTKSAKPVHEMIDTKTEDLFDAPLPVASQGGSHVYRNRWKYFFILLVVALLSFLGSKGYIVAAVVNGQPIFGWDVENAMMTRYGTQMIDALVSERLVADAAQKAGITVSQADVDKKISELVKSLGPNVKLEDLLAYQGISKTDFQKQVRLQMIIEKLLGKDVKIADSDIDAYIEKNKETLTATDEAGIREEARQALFSQAISSKVQSWFADLKSKASVIRILK